MFKISTDKKVISESSGSKFINSSGVYPVTINRANVGVSKGGAENFVFNIKFNENDQTLYGPWYKAKNGDFLEIGVGLYTTLGIIANLEDGQEFTVEEEECLVGKDNKEMTLDVIQELTDLDIQLHLQQEYDLWNGAITEKLVIRGFFNAEGHSAEEIINGENQGKRLSLVKEKYASNISYKNGVTPEDVEAWIKGGRGKGTSPAPKKAAAKTGSIFGKKS